MTSPFLSATKTLSLTLVVSLLCGTIAPAQDQEQQRRRRHLPGGAAAPFQTFPDNSLSFQPPGDYTPFRAPLSPSAALPGEAIPVQFEARYAKGGSVPKQGVRWRIFADKPEADGAYVMVAEGADGSVTLPLRPGGYIATVSLGTLVLSRPITVSATSRREEFALDAGGLKLTGQVSGKALPATSLSVDVYQGSYLDAGEPKPVLRQARAGEVLILPAGTYNVTSTWGDANATIRADVKVQPGKLTEATMNHRAALVNLRLVLPQGGSPVANATWSVLTPGGDVIKEAIGAFPSVVLAEGDYLAMARYDGKVYNKKFKIEPGTDMDVDIVAQ